MGLLLDRRVQGYGGTAARLSLGVGFFRTVRFLFGVHSYPLEMQLVSQRNNATSVAEDAVLLFNDTRKWN
jgi:hypothetical protein